MRRLCGLAAALIAAISLSSIQARAQEQPAPELGAPIDYAAVTRWLRALPPEQLIAIAWNGTGQEQRALSIARRESGMRCDADNPRSSAAGLFQTISIHAPRAARLGLTWGEIAGPDCLSDILLAKSLWQEQGWRPWRL